MLLNTGGLSNQIQILYIYAKVLVQAFQNGAESYEFNNAITRSFWNDI